MSRDWLVRLEDMLGAIEKIEGISWADLQASGLTALALERAFEILSEASRYIPAEIKQRHAGGRWQDLADLGNILRHAYHRVALERLWETARDDVPPLKAVLLLIKQKESSG